MSKVSPEWADQVGKGKSVQRPTGISAPGNEGVSSSIKSTPYAIGYIEFHYALTTGMPYAYLQNQEGNFIELSIDSVRTAIAASAGSLPNGEKSWEHVSTTDAPGEDSYPISSFSYLLLYKELSTNPRIDSMDKAIALVDFAEWAITDGQQFADDLAYVPLPEEAVQINEETLESITYNGQPVLAEERVTSTDSLGLFSPIIAASIILAIAAGSAIYIWRKRRGSLAPKEISTEPRERRETRDKISYPLLRGTLAGDRIFRFIVISAAGYMMLLLGLVAVSIFSG
ncbi:putative phosphate ABC transporter, periplasmic phosphate-binding protein [Candidatus Nitrososphaera gargensis Ga9.2]|uniref:Putative phosphate ABC transporter, periplasmic phosphate-binding protein n=1 Tax=Nitrososphaera gargensis (strain Ga9.2) TaxID=1237085 RepID=K0IGH2_NITGG|nr:substrate-binding domain-containing protein [Candidatus Nitrososphaera gargensis]AFU60491.1 putative phosphate ABC transporter, periplasmic phosphate-binding protein [Candidatus Nitrososphaera gargensis Ga9.2]